MCLLDRTEEKQIYTIIGFSKNDAFYGTKDRIGKRVTLGSGSWIGAWWAGSMFPLDELGRYYSFQTKLKKYEPNK